MSTKDDGIRRRRREEEEGFTHVRQPELETAGSELCKRNECIVTAGEQEEFSDGDGLFRVRDVQAAFPEGERWSSCAVCSCEADVR